MHAPWFLEEDKSKRSTCDCFLGCRGVLSLDIECYVSHLQNFWPQFTEQNVSVLGDVHSQKPLSPPNDQTDCRYSCVMSEGTQSDFQQLNPVFEDDGQFKLTFGLLGSNIGLQNLYYIFAERQIYPILILSAMANNLFPCEIPTCLR